MRKIIVISFLLVMFFNSNLAQEMKRPIIPVKNSTKVNLDYSLIKCGKLDTSLKFSESVSDSLAEYLKIVKQKGNYKGLCVAIGVPGKGFWNSSLGESGSIEDLSVDTKIHILSAGKIFTASLILKLCENGYLKVEDPVSKWIPEFKMGDEIKIVNLLNHTSGLESYEATKEFNENNDNRYLPEKLYEIACGYSLRFDPGTNYSYSNTGYILLGLIAERVLGKPMEKIFNEYFIAPLKLRNTLFCSKENLKMEGIQSFSKDGIMQEKEWPLTYSAGPFISTPKEILILYNYILSGNFISDSSMKIMLSHMNIISYKPDVYYGLGVSVIKDLPSGNYLGHSGGYNGFRTCIYYNIENKVFTAVMSNTNTFEVEPAMFFLTERTIGMLRK